MGTHCTTRREPREIPHECVPAPPSTPAWPPVYNYFFEFDKYIERLKSMDINELEVLNGHIPKLSKLLLALYNISNASADDWEHWGCEKYGDGWSSYLSDSDPEPCHEPPDGDG